MKLHNHIVVSTIISGVSQYIFNSWQMSITVFLSGIFIDLDHLLDYFIYEKKIELDLKDFFYKCGTLTLEKEPLILHSYELITVLAIVSYFINNYIIVGLLLGLGTHIVFDIFTNKVYFLGYSFIFRLIHKFNYRKVFYG